MSEWIKTAKVGDKVVCVDVDGLVETKVPYGTLKLGSVYTIREVYQGDVRGDELGRKHPFVVRLNEIVRGETDTGYGPFRFRPVTPRKTDISVFTDMLKTVGKPIEEHA